MTMENPAKIELQPSQSPKAPSWLMDVSNLFNIDSNICDVDTPGKMAKPKRRRRQKKSRGTPRRFQDEYEATHVVLGRGAFGSVHVYRHLTSGTEFAVKVVEKRDEARRQRVLKEVDICRQFQDCKSIINLVDFFEETDKFFLVFEKVEGGDFFSLLESRDYISEPEASKFIAELASALQVLHSKGIAHRDIKPENVLCTTSGQATPLRLCDFDLASNFPSRLRPSEDTQGPIGFKSKLGTTEYMPPEILTVSKRKPSTYYDVKCDVWSLGVLLYIMLFADLPFEGDCGQDDCPATEDFTTCKACNQDLFAAIRRGDFSFPRVSDQPVSDRAKDLIERLLVCEPIARLSASDILKHPFVTAQQDGASSLPTENTENS